jgi:AmmeMemoRadiSam system protein A
MKYVNPSHIDQGGILLPIARAAIGSEWGQESATHADAPWLYEPGACFVTLTQQGKLRGCIGTLEAHRPLLLDVKANARAAAFSDPRFAPLRPDELAYTAIEISLLSAMQPLSFASEADALARLRPNIDGVVFEYGRYRSTFLPQVWEQLPEPRAFLAHLKAKAGLPASFWHDAVQLYRYTVSKFTEQERSAAAAPHE